MLYNNRDHCIYTKYIFQKDLRESRLGGKKKGERSVVDMLDI